MLVGKNFFWVGGVGGGGGGGGVAPEWLEL